MKKNNINRISEVEELENEVS